MLKRITTLIAAVTLVALGGLVPVGSAAASTPSATSATGSIVGTVTDHGSHPLAGACVGLSTAAPTQPSVRTAADGSYALTNLAPSAYSYTVTVDPTCSSDPSAIDDLAFRSNEFYVNAGVTTRIDASLALGGSVHGIILDVNGNPQANVCVRVTSPGLFGAEDFNPQTGADGSFVIHAVSPGSYVFEIGCDSTTPDIQPEYYDAASEYGTQNNDFTVVDVAAGQTVDLLPQRTRPAADIDIRIQVGGGNQVSGVQPVAIPVNANTSLDAAGNVVPLGNNQWLITNLLPLVYKIGYQACPASAAVKRCRDGYIGFYSGVPFGESRSGHTDRADRGGDDKPD